ncbi:MAG: response regulator transcription factor [bacterium]|nr:response regulator transcription factor [bacterium]
MIEKKILVVEDDPDIRELVGYNLRKEGYKVLFASSGVDGLEMAIFERPDLILLDIMLPGMDGFQVCREIRRSDVVSKTPIIMMTAKSDERDMVSSLDIGADDYITKPFGVRVLVARVRAKLRAAASLKSDKDIVEAGGLKIDPRSYSVTIDDKPVDLTLTEFRILMLLTKNPGWVLSRYEIIDAVHGQHIVVTDRSVDVQIFGLRQKLGRLRNSIETIRGVGYKFTTPSN